VALHPISKQTAREDVPLLNLHDQPGNFLTPSAIILAPVTNQIIVFVKYYKLFLPLTHVIRPLSGQTLKPI
jgi:hypothetical protein